MKGEGANQQDHCCINMSHSRSNVQLIFFFLLTFENILVFCKYAKDSRSDGGQLLSFLHIVNYDPYLYISPYIVH
jgi:hypothetical protein